LSIKFTSIYIHILLFLNLYYIFYILYLFNHTQLLAICHEMTTGHRELAERCVLAEV